MNVINIVMVAVGGQGNLLILKVLGEAAVLSGVKVNINEIHGLAQRGGIVESSIVLGGARSAVVPDGRADILLGLEPLETLRALNKCHPDSLVITNTRQYAPYAVSVGASRYPSLDEIKARILQKTKRLVTIDALSLAIEAGSPLVSNMVLLGELLNTGSLPISYQAAREAIRKKVRRKMLDVNLAAFDLGYFAEQRGQKTGT